MTPGRNFSLAVLGVLILACLGGSVAAASLGTEWKERPYTENPFSGVRFSDDGNYVFATGDQVLLRSWDGEHKWGGRAGTVAAVSGNAEYVVDGIGTSLVLLEKTMADDWSRNMNGQVKAVAISKNGSLIISADSDGNYNSWAKNGAFNGRSKEDVVKKIALSPTENVVVATTEHGLRFFAPNMELVWSDNKTSSIDTYILITSDGKTVITYGGNRVSSHTSTGTVNWVVNPTENAIIDMAINRDGSAIILGSQDGTITALDRYGKTRWTYDAGQWINAVGISGDATLIAAGGLDGTVYVLDRTGKVITKKKMDTGIQQRSLAVSPDGTRIAVADQINLYGLSVMGDASPGVMETFTQRPLDPVKTVEPQVTTTPAIIVPETTVIIEKTPLPPTPTKKSPAGFFPVLGALAAAGLVLVIRRR